MPILFYVTCPHTDAAMTLGRSLVDEGLVACINVLPGMTSVYRWRGHIEEAQEAVLLVKAPSADAGRVREAILARHPYDLPCILELPVIGGHPPYLAWLEARGS